MSAANENILPATFWGGKVPGLALAGAIAAAALTLRSMTGIGALSPMLVAVFVGIAIRLLVAPGEQFTPGLRFATRPVLRLGIILLGAQVTLTAIISLGLAPLLVAGLTLAATYTAVVGVGRLIGVPLPLSQLIAAGTSVCGASAIVAANAVARGEEEDVGYAVACVTLFGTIAMLALPLLAPVLGLSTPQFGVWTGASIHEVAQVTAAAFQRGVESGQVGTLTKLIRVMLLAPLIITMTAFARTGRRTAAQAPFPWFVIWFLVLVGINSTGIVPDWTRPHLSLASAFCMVTGLAAMGLGMDLRQLRNRGLKPLMLGLFGLGFVTTVSLLLVKTVM
ncbi:putative sulfate exporter family transporter [Paracoccus suum]|uniref:Putative sulfate exporter family transporter n=1 Tax=Paracoccus suum TaxID=2259340 RepID=A0A344PNL8_9RHOB|nr:putative sulfate exporter family transporter [Paracoccus suum]AXC50973.1 putative sulfate exporter family transporter [Paracoccus suum]